MLSGHSLLHAARPHMRSHADYTSNETLPNGKPEFPAYAVSAGSTARHARLGPNESPHSAAAKNVMRIKFPLQGRQKT